LKRIFDIKEIVSFNLLPNMDITSIEAVNSELRDQIDRFADRLNVLSVYNKDELYEKGQMLSNLQSVEGALLDTLNSLKTKITEQKQVLEKYMREAEESFNAVRQNIYNTPHPQKGSEDVKKNSPVNFTASAATFAPKVAKPAKSLKPFAETFANPNVKAVPKVTEMVLHTNATSNPNSWTEVGRKTVKPKLSKREVAPDLFIQAVTVNSLEECHNYLGWWCWYQEQQRFCISINGKIYAGNTTIIHDVNKQPVKFFEHRRCDKVDNWKESDYYIPIERNPDSRDSRHFTNKMKFVPASRSPEKYETYCYRLGSRDTLRDDVMSLKSEDYRLFSDLTCNFLLCLTAASVEMDRRSVV